MSDAELVALLRKRPKETPQMRTQKAFQRFFRGVPRQRVEALLLEAFQELPPDERDAKVQKRLQLLGGGSSKRTGPSGPPDRGADL